ncbi:MAG: tRNA (adenosine(37)-N6)-threonylcarbamoyltransferase complex ATPase subunit type 1 TsaE [Crocinitomicaceae bacterium]|nr:tRNA (adenosine(37)-N6)-threonylcarbamoyltransferase complex ATPase subunit type 1 TsaE [Crocinitomicaceae bacterium]MDG1777113.1 tRNA (adenosine(37)-N6)-threonylcarbamoyltransferase complex ATPase subunit type 1 TsaE [Crocinitomicaceae bacterium]
MEIKIDSLEDLPRAATEFIEAVGHRKVFAFNADMGAGKTTFITAVLQAMGVDSLEGSPTYSLVNVYDSQMFGRLNHFDFYRINDETEALDIGIEEMLYSDDMCFIEWPEKIQNLLPDNVIWSYIRVNEDNSRTLTVET